MRERLYAMENTSPDNVLNVYLPLALAQIPRLLSRQDREACSKTYGAFDRTFWGWKFTDFHGARFQEALYPMAWLYTTQAQDNPYYKNARVQEWIRAGFVYWQSLQHTDGSFDEAYPFERSLAAVSFTGFYLGEAFLRMGADFPADIRASVIKTFERAGDWLCDNDEHHGVLSNHLAAAAAALEVIARITNGPRYADRAKHFINRILSCQSEEGWYEEYGGADFGYQTHGTFYLARYWQSTKDTRLLESLIKSVQFIAHFVHPNGTLGGEYGSRNTAFYFPAAYEILAPVCSEAAAMAKFMRVSVAAQKATGLAMMDAYNFCPLLNNYFFALDAAKDLPDGVLPFQRVGHYDFPKAGLAVHVTDRYQAVFAPSKGGVLKIYDKQSAKLAYSDCGYWANMDGKRVSSQSFSLSNETTYRADSLNVKAPFARINQKVMSPFLFMGFRGFMLTVGRQKQLALLIKNILVKLLVSRRKTMDISLLRKVSFGPDSVTIDDLITASEGLKGLIFNLDAKFSTIHMGSSRYYQPDELDPPLLQGIESNERTYTWNAQ